MNTIPWIMIVGTMSIMFSAHAHDTVFNIALANAVNDRFAQLQSRADFGESCWQSLSQLLYIEEQLIACLMNGFADVYFDYIVTTRTELLEQALDSVHALRERMLDAAMVFAAQNANILDTLRTVPAPQRLSKISNKKRNQFLQSMSQALNYYYDRVQHQVQSE